MQQQKQESSVFTGMQATFITELSGMTWELLLAAHPDRSDELHALWDEVKFFADLVVRDPVLYQELIHRIETGGKPR